MGSFLGMTPSTLTKYRLSPFKQGIYLKSTNSSIIIKLRGSGDITIDNDTKTLSLDKDTIFEINKAEISFNNIYNITELNVSEQNLTKLVINENSLIEKLVCYNNKLTELDLTYLPNLHYLHIFGNKFCANDNEDKLKQILYSLPNREEKPFGSVIIYDYLPIPEWTSPFGEGYAKYPGRISNIEALGKDTENEPIFVQELKELREGDYYRLHASETEDIYDYTNDGVYQYVNGELIEQIDYNRLVNLRRAVEPDLLQKKWVFGSAIQYHEDYNLCNWYFKKLGIQDFWETAEHGLGLTIGHFDMTSGNMLGFEDLNLSSYFRFYDEIESEDRVALDKLTSNPYDNHGDATSYNIFAQGKTYDIATQIMGIAPEACAVLGDATASGNGDVARTGYTVSKNDAQYAYTTFRKTTDILTQSMITTFTAKDKIQAIEDYTNEHIWIYSGPNNGDDIEWTVDEDPNHTDTGILDYEGEYITIGTNQFYICGNLGYDNYLVDSSPSRFFNSYTTELNLENYIVSYGTCIKTWYSYEQKNRYSQGCSEATPINAGVLALMMIIYKKMYSITDRNFGWNTENGKGFREFVRLHSNALKDSLLDGVGSGIPDMMNSCKDINPSAFSDYTVDPPLIFTKQLPSINRPVCYSESYKQLYYKNKKYDIFNDDLPANYMIPSRVSEDGSYTLLLKIPSFGTAPTTRTPYVKWSISNSDNILQLYRTANKPFGLALIDYIEDKQSKDYYCTTVGPVNYTKYPTNDAAIVTIVVTKNNLAFYINGIHTGSIYKIAELGDFTTDYDYKLINDALTEEEIIQLATYMLKE